MIFLACLTRERMKERTNPKEQKSILSRLKSCSLGTLLHLVQQEQHQTEMLPALYLLSTKNVE